MAVHGFPGPGRCGDTPDPVDDPVDRYRSAPVHDQRGQHAALLGMPQVHDRAVDARSYLTEHPQHRAPREDDHDRDLVNHFSTVQAAEPWILDEAGRSWTV